MLVNHVPFLPGSRPGSVRLGDLWYEDLCAQAEAIARVGGKLVVATPFGGVAQEGSFGTIEIECAKAPFAYEPLPGSDTLGGFVRALPSLRARLAKILASADLAHIALGGHPIPPGSVAWLLAGRAQLPRILVFDGSDEVERRWEAVRHGSRVKWPLRWLFARYFDGFCRRAIGAANLVFAHNASIPRRYAEAWRTHCHEFPRSFVTDDLLISDAALEERALRIRTGDPLVLAVVGRQVPIKATDHVLRAIELARAQGARIRLLVIGDGTSLTSYRALASELGLQQEVEFCGAVPYGEALFQLWDRAHATVITNLTAEISRSVLLSMARGIPLIMYENPGTDAMLPAAATSLAPSGDVTALADRFLQHFRERSGLSSQLRLAHRFAAENSLETCHRKRAELARDLVTGARAPKRRAR